MTVVAVVPVVAIGIEVDVVRVVVVVLVRRRTPVVAVLACVVERSTVAVARSGNFYGAVIYTEKR